MRTLIGYSGFVGSNLASSGSFDIFINSQNSKQLRGLHTSEVVCAGVSAVKWKANQYPQEDLAHINQLIDNLRELKTDHFTLVSTVDVYQRPIEVDEQTPITDLGLHYGGNRAMLETFVAESFPNHSIVRLPALFGKGLRKNVIFDLCHDKMINVIDPKSSFQWYDVSRLARDIEIIIKSGVSVINIVSAPIPTDEIIKRFFPDKIVSAINNRFSSSYDVKTKYAHILAGTGSYHYTACQVFKDLERYLLQGGWL